MEKLDIFIKGELIDLCIPTPEFARDSEWYSWFNNPNTNRYLEQGAFPNSREDELAFFQNERLKRLLLAIVDKEGETLGVISLSAINFAKREADVAIVLSEKEKPVLSGLEAMALITQHAFTIMGLTRIQGGQHQALRLWGNLMELIGYRNEGIWVNGFIKGSERVNVHRFAINIEDYNIIVKSRGALWDSNANMFKRIRKMPKKSYIDQLYDFYNNTREEYYKSVFSL